MVSPESPLTHPGCHVLASNRSISLSWRRWKSIQFSRSVARSYFQPSSHRPAMEAAHIGALSRFEEAPTKETSWSNFPGVECAWAIFCIPHNGVCNVVLINPFNDSPDGNDYRIGREGFVSPACSIGTNDNLRKIPIRCELASLQRQDDQKRGKDERTIGWGQHLSLCPPKVFFVAIPGCAEL